MQVSNDSAAAMNPRAVLRMLGFTEPEVDAIIDRIRQRQNQREAIAFVARARAVSEGYSEDVANRIANIVVSPVYVPYHNALLQVRRAFQQANDKRVAVDANDDEEEEENNEDDNDDDEEEDDDDDDEEEDEPATMSGQGRLAQAIQLRR
jgi:phosphopantothenoylcysteine synthetase/decarboxylase